MKSVYVTMQGVSALLMHAFPLEPVEALEKKTPEEQAEHGAYRDPESGMLYIPAVALQRGLINGATFSKGKGRATLQKPVAASVLVAPERLDLKVKTYRVDTRPVVMPSTRGRVLRHRPRLDQWEVSCEIQYDENLITETQLRRVVDDTGTRVGLLDFRPACKGPFGRFMVTAWKS